MLCDIHFNLEEHVYGLHYLTTRNARSNHLLKIQSTCNVRSSNSLAYWFGTLKYTLQGLGFDCPSINIGRLVYLKKMLDP